MRYLKEEKGITLVELIVAMGIFLVVVTIAVGAFVSLIRLQSQSENMTSVQQNGRIALEQVTRLGRQAESVNILGSGDLEALGFSISGTKICFGEDNGRLKKYDDYNIAGSTCSGNAFTLTGEDVNVTKFNFDTVSGIPSTLNIGIEMESKYATYGTEKNNILLNTSVVLTGLK